MTLLSKKDASNEDWTHDLWFTRPTLCHWAIEAYVYTWGKLCLERCSVPWHKNVQGTHGFEPWTYRTAADCSTTELYPQLCKRRDKTSHLYFVAHFLEPWRAETSRAELEHFLWALISHMCQVLSPDQLSPSAVITFQCKCSTCPLFLWREMRELEKN